MFKNIKYSVEVVKEVIEEKTGRHIPTGVAVAYCIITVPIGIILSPFMVIKTAWLIRQSNMEYLLEIKELNKRFEGRA